ncbi:MAG: hypothetical protein LBI18_05560 [Planctomycetaceae bacterium]|nr:hypothetical protein [Planctomycetaceae bacterium]
MSSTDRWTEIASQIGGMNHSEVPDMEEAGATVAQNQPEIIANPPAIRMEKVAHVEPDSFGKGLLEETLPTETANTTEETPPPASKNRDIKKKFFERFPRINLFGSSTKATLEAVVEGVKSPSLSGKSFTSSKLEKVPVSDYASKIDKKSSHSDFETASVNRSVSDEIRAEENLPNTNPLPNTQPEVFSHSDNVPEQTICSEQSARAIVDILDPWSQVASQVGALTNPHAQSLPSSDVDSHVDLELTAKVGDSATVETGNTRESTENTVNSHGHFDKNAKYYVRKRPSRSLPSMFDEPTPESEESATLKNLMESELYATEAEKRLRSIFSEDEKEVTTSEEVNHPGQNANYSDKQHKEHYRYSEKRTTTVSRYSEIEEREEPQQSQTAPSDTERSDRHEGSRQHSREFVRERGRRGTRFEQHGEKTEYNIPSKIPKSDVESYLEAGEGAWDIEESQPVERSRGRHRRGRSIEKHVNRKDYLSSKLPTNIFETSLTSNEEKELVQLHKNIPSWDEAIDCLIENNIARHLQSSSPRNNNSGRR